MLPSDDDAQSQMHSESPALMLDTPSELETCDWYHAETHVIASTAEEWQAPAFPQLRIHLEYTIAHLLRVIVEAESTVWRLEITDPMRGHVVFPTDDHGLADSKIAYLRWALDQVGVHLRRD